MTFKSMILGSAAAIMAVSSVQAADLPVAEPVDYVRVCDWHGDRAAFFVNNMMSQGTCVIDPTGIISMRCLEA